MHIHTLEHEPVEGPGAIADWAAARGHTLHRCRMYEAHTLPPLPGTDLLAIMGGPMDIHQHRDFPWLVEEKAFIARAIDANIPTLGICLGAQLVADALGAKVVQNPEKEIGWWPVRFLDRTGHFAHFPPEMTVMHWHGDTFTLPAGARQVAESDACAQQGFVWDNRVVGLQFHLEMHPIGVADLSGECAAEFIPSRWVQSVEEVLRIQPGLASTHAALFTLLDSMLARWHAPG